jgi:hypothetical protein
MASDMEPVLTTDPALLDVLEELKRREPIFHHPEFGTTRADFANMTTPDFWEVGASGSRYSREFVLDTLEKRYAGPYTDDLEAFGFHCRQLGPDVYLITYTLIQDKVIQDKVIQDKVIQDKVIQDKVRTTRRSTIWQRTADGWKIVFHQGTIVQDAAQEAAQGT